MEELVTLKGYFWELFIYVYTIHSKALCNLQSILIVIFNFMREHFFMRELFLHTDICKGIWHDTKSKWTYWTMLRYALRNSCLVYFSSNILHSGKLETYVQKPKCWSKVAWNNYLFMLTPKSTVNSLPSLKLHFTW